MIRLFVLAVLAFAAYIVYQAERRQVATPPPPKRRKPRPAAKRAKTEGNKPAARS
jgi:Na+-transporting methylmalonyl-CoA/oxaloacetate decarboxylase gamma subunit